MGKAEVGMRKVEWGNRTRRRLGRKGLWRGKHGEGGMGNGLNAECGMGKAASGP